MFWDKLKPTTPEPKATSVEVTPEREIAVTWDDGQRSLVASIRLRAECPCAGCVDEWTGKRIVESSKIPVDVRPLHIEPVGNYALQIRWSDGHETGIYTWRQLRTYAVG